MITIMAIPPRKYSPPPAPSVMAMIGMPKISEQMARPARWPPLAGPSPSASRRAHRESGHRTQFPARDGRRVSPADRAECPRSAGSVASSSETLPAPSGTLRLDLPACASSASSGRQIRTGPMRMTEIRHRPLRGYASAPTTATCLQTPDLRQHADELALAPLHDLGCPDLLAQHLCRQRERRNAVLGREVRHLLDSEAVVHSLHILDA